MSSDTDDITGGMADGSEPLAARKRRTSMIDDGTLDFNSASARFEEARFPAANVDPGNVAAIADLLARMEELLRPPSESRETVLVVGPLRLDLLTRTVRRGECEIALRPREFRLLEYMMRHKGQVLTREILFREVWHYKFTPQSNLVDVHIGRLRRKIDGPHEPPLIYNVRRKGFVLQTLD